MSGKKIVLTDEKGGIATITTSNVYQSNGVIDVIDRVLMPTNLSSSRSGAQGASSEAPFCFFFEDGAHHPTFGSLHPILQDEGESLWQPQRTKHPAELAMQQEKSPNATPL